MATVRLRAVWVVTLAVVAVALALMGWLWPRRITTVLLVRHAEKETEAQPVFLSDAGHARARELVHVVGEAGLAAAYTTEFVRNQQTVRPLAEALGIPTHEIPASDVAGLVDHIMATYEGRVVLAAGHRGTLPEIIEALGGETPTPIVDEDYDDLFVVIVPRLGETRVVHLSYGAAPAASASEAE